MPIRFFRSPVIKGGKRKTLTKIANSKAVGQKDPIKISVMNLQGGKNSPLAIAKKLKINPQKVLEIIAKTRTNPQSMPKKIL